MMMSWNLNDLSTRAPGATLAIFSPSGYMFANEGTQHVVYQGRLGDGSGDGRIHELWWRDDEWHHNDLTAATGAPLVSREPSGYAFENQNTQHVVYQGFVPGQGDDHHIHELWRDDEWHHNDLTAATGAPSASGEPSGYVFAAQNTQHVLYLGTDSHVHELWWQNGWHHNDLTAATGAPLASDQPTGFAFDAGGTQLVHYRGTNGHIHQLWWSSAEWHHLDLTTTVGGPAAAPSRPIGYVFPFEGTLHVDYLGSDGHIHEFWRDSSAWHHNDLTAATGAPLAISNPTGYVFAAQNTQHVVFTADNHHIIELFWLPN
jgi:hypothetical protein